MGRALLVLDGPITKRKAVDWIGKAPIGTRVEFKASKRTLPQNDMLWALLTEISQQLDHGGTKYDPSQWKAIFLHAFGREVSFLPSLDRKTFLPLELSSSDLSKDEMTDFIEFIMKEAGERGVVFRDHRQTEDTPSGGTSTPDAPILECAREMLALAGLSYDTTADRDEAMSQCVEQWEVSHPGLLDQINDIAVAARLVATGTRDVGKARQWLATRLECDPADIGGKANG